jgi:hypothetical protein
MELRLSTKALLAAFIGLTPLPGFTQTLWAPPPLALRGEARPTVAREMVSSFKIGATSVVFEQTELGDLARAFGVAMGHQGDASESLQWFCLTGTAKQGPWVLWLTSGEIDGGRVGGVQLQSLLRGQRVDSRCGLWRSEAIPIEMPVTLRLGMPRREVIRALGSASASAEELLEYVHQHEERRAEPKAPEAPVFIAMNSVTVWIHRGIVQGFHVWKSTQS